GFTRAIFTWAHDGDRLDSRLTAAGGTTNLRVDIGDQRHLEFDTRRLELLDQLGLRAGGELRYNQSIVDDLFPLPPDEGNAEHYNFSTAPPLMLDFES